MFKHVYSSVGSKVWPCTVCRELYVLSTFIPLLDQKFGHVQYFVYVVCLSTFIPLLDQKSGHVQYFVNCMFKHVYSSVGSKVWPCTVFRELYV